MKPTIEINTIRKVAVKNNHPTFYDASFFAVSNSTEHQPSSDPERTTFFGIGLCTAGSILLQANLKTYLITAGSLIAISPFTLFYWEQQSPDYQVLKIFFEESLLLSFLSDKQFIKRLKLFSDGEASVQVIHKEDVNYFTSLFTAVTEKVKTHLNNEAIVASGLTMLLSELDQSLRHSKALCLATENPPLNHKQELVLRFKNAVSKEFLTNRSVKKYADALNVTPSYLGEVVKEITGKSPTEVIEDLILLEAKMLLRQSILTISEVADHLDYYDSSFFTKFFKSRTGLTPTEFRRK